MKMWNPLEQIAAQAPRLYAAINRLAIAADGAVETFLVNASRR